MSYVVPFEGWQPPPRTDGHPWTQIRIRESANEDGPWTTIDTIPMSPVDANPASPAYRDFTTENASLANGWYEIGFLDADGDESVFPAIHRDTVSGPAWRPSVDDIAKLLPGRANARFTGGAGTPAFPDEARVNAIIDLATSTISARLGGDRLPAKFFDAARALTVLRVALTLEPAAWPEQARPDKSSWEQWKALYDEDMPALVETIKQDVIDGDDGDGGPEFAGTLPLYSFPPPASIVEPNYWGH